jgi:hypothetical protein
LRIKKNGRLHLYRGGNLVTTYVAGFGAVQGDDQTVLRSVFYNKKGEEVSANDAIDFSNGYLKPGYTALTN